MEFSERELLQHNIFLYTGSATQAEIKSPEFTGMRMIHPGSMWIMPQGSRHRVRFERPMEGIVAGSAVLHPVDSCSYKRPHINVVKSEIVTDWRCNESFPNSSPDEIPC
jgi:hypothetical protein